MKNYHKNPRQIKDKQFRDLRAWLAELGDLSGIVHDLNTDEVISGNQRMRAIDIARCEIVLTEGPHEPDAQGTVAHGYVIWQGAKYNYRQVRWTPEQCEKANIVANKAGGSWDFDILANEWEKDDLLEWGFELEELGMLPDDETPDDPGAQIDRAEELRELWQTEVGQLWAIGEHRLIVGDCRDPGVWERLLEGVKVNGVFTSPPYAEQRKEQYGGVPTAEYVEWWEAVQANVKANLAGDGSFFVNIKPHCEDGERVLYVFDLVLAMRRRWGWRFVDELCWLHEDLPGAWPNRFRNGFEPVYQFSMDAAIKFIPRAVAKPSASVRNGRGGLQKRDGGNWTLDAPLVHGMAQPSNVIHAGGNTDGVSHAAAFPVSLLDFFIRAYSDTGDLWLDPFCGSGTTIVAAHNNNRRGYGIELLPKYAAVILERLQDMGLTPELVVNSVETVQNAT